MGDSKEPESDKDPGLISTSEDEVPAVQGASLSVHTRWRELARQIQQETDPQKMFELVRQLLAEFDDQAAQESASATGEEMSPLGSDIPGRIVQRPGYPVFLASQRLKKSHRLYRLGSAAVNPPKARSGKPDSSS